MQQTRIFACLDEGIRVDLAQTIADVRLKAGEWAIREGEPGCFLVILEGSLRLFLDAHGKPTEFSILDPHIGGFMGEVPLMLGIPFFASVFAQTDCRIARLDKQQFHRLIRSSEEARDMVLKQLSERLSLVQERTLALETSRVFIYGRRRDTDCHELRVFLSDNRIPYEWIDRDRHPERVPAGASDDPDCPAVSVDGKLFAQPPTAREVAEALQLQTEPSRDEYDVLIVGGGPARYGRWGVRNLRRP